MVVEDRLVEDPLVELEPSELAVDVERGVCEVAGRRNLADTVGVRGHRR